MQAEQVAALVATSKDGEEMQAFKDNAMPVFERLVLAEIEKAALKALKDPELNLSDTNQLYQLRALAQTADLIRKRIDLVIMNGKNARTLLLNSTPKEGEQ